MSEMTAMERRCVDAIRQTWVALDECRSLAIVRAVLAEAGVAEMREALDEIADHAETRIKDGVEMGASIWRIALVDVSRIARARTRKGRTMTAPSNPPAFPFEVDHLDRDELPEVLELAGKLAWQRGGQTHPICSYDIDIARETITGEVNEIARLRSEVASLRAMLSAREAQP